MSLDNWFEPIPVHVFCAVSSIKVGILEKGAFYHNDFLFPQNLRMSLKHNMSRISQKANDWLVVRVHNVDTLFAHDTNFAAR